MEQKIATKGLLSLSLSLLLTAFVLPNASTAKDIEISTNIRDLTINTGDTDSVYVRSGGEVSSIVNRGTIDFLQIDKDGVVHTLANVGRGRTNSVLINGGYIQTLGGGVTNLTLNDGQIGEAFRATNVHIKSWAINLDKPAAQWNSDGAAGVTGQIKNLKYYPHLYMEQGTSTNLSIDRGAITIALAQGAESAGIYWYDNIITGGAGNGKINSSHIKGADGIVLHNRVDSTGRAGFSLSANVSTSYGANILRNMTLSYMRRNVMTQNILDSMSTKTFRSEYITLEDLEEKMAKVRTQIDKVLQEANEAKEERAKKNKRQSRRAREKEEAKYEEKTRQEIEGLQKDLGELQKEYEATKKQSRYIIDTVDAIFIPYEGKRNWRAFAMPYAVHSYADLNVSTGHEWVGGMLAGIQRNLRRGGILGLYMGYEKSSNTSTLQASSAQINTTRAQMGLNYFATYPSKERVGEWFVKFNIRGGMDFPLLDVQMARGEIKQDLTSYSAGVEGRAGYTFFYPDSQSYLSPELSVSYDMLSLQGFSLDKSSLNQANETYPTHNWHFPQVGVNARYYKSFGSLLKTSVALGAKYNTANKPIAKFSLGTLKDSAPLVLPKFYGNLEVNVIVSLMRNHEITAGYTGVYFSQFRRGGEFGISTALAVKYSYWF